MFTTSFSGGTGVVARVNGWSLGCGNGIESPTGPLRFWSRFWPAASFEFDNQFYTGDEIRISPVGVAQTLDHFSSFSLQASGIPALELSGESLVATNPITMQIERFGNAVAISWSPSGAGQVLLCANRASGPFWKVPGATVPPYVTSIGSTNQFYRVRQQ